MNPASSNKENGDIPLASIGASKESARNSPDASSAGTDSQSNHVTSDRSPELVVPIEKPDQSDPNSIIKLSKRRWLVLATMSLIGLCATISVTTSPILGLVLELLDLREDQYLYLRQIFTYVSALTSIPTAWFVDKYGIKRSIQTAVLFYAVGSLLRAALYSPSLPGWIEYRMFCWFLGGFIGSQAGAIFFMLPLKVAETWFSAKERSVAWTLMVSTGDLGTCAVSLIYPRIMQTLADIQILGYINVVAPILTSIICLTCISTDAPKHPPSERQARANKLKVVPFKTSMKRIITNKDIVLHLLHPAIHRAGGMSIASVYQKILTNAGHSTIFAGNLMSINALVSIVMLILMSSFVHKTENPVFICKLSAGVKTTVNIIYMIFLINQMPGWSLIVMSTLLTVCRSWSVPHSTNIMAHLAAGLVSQATIVGFSVTTGLVVMTVINVTFAALIQFDGEGQNRVSDYTRPLMFIILVTGVNEAIYQLFFRGKSTNEEKDGEPPAKTKDNQQDVESNSHKD